MPAAELGIAGTDLAIRPQGTPASGGDGCRRCPFHQEPGPMGEADTSSVMALRMTALGTARSCSGIAERQCHKFCALVRLHPEQNGVLALATRVGKAFANLR